MTRKRKATRNDVAALAGVSPAVVSYVINQSKFVSEEKTKAVLRAVEQLQYRPNENARALKTGQFKRIAFVCDNLRNDWLEIPEKLFFDRGYTVSHVYSRDGDAFIQRLISGQYDGIFMLSNRYSSDQLNRIAREGIPIVLYKTREYQHTLHENISTVVPNCYDGVSKAVNYLLMKGHKRIIFAPPLRYDMTNFEGGFRERAFMDTLKKAGIEVDPTYICKHTETIEELQDELFQILLGVSPDERATAVITSNDYMAGKLVSYIRKMGLKVPDSMAVVGMDNTYLAEMVTPTLTSVDFSKEDFGRELVESMLSMINGQKPEDKYIKMSLVIRESA
ncbi:MAG: LacI family DNA-binding transcriptional regulator [Lachnospiraceae bacterium]|nr:LacI family DNA-binding transcriptional regulator [Lachnospiraceae bacterium]